MNVFLLMVLTGLILIVDRVIFFPKRKKDRFETINTKLNEENTLPENEEHYLIKTPGFIQVCQLLFILAAIFVLVDLLGIELLLVLAVGFSLVAWLLYLVVCRYKQKEIVIEPQAEPTKENNVQRALKKIRLFENTQYRDMMRSIFFILLVVLILRSFVVEPYRVPTGSLKPTIKIGDFIAVNKYAYGIRLPVLGTKIFKVGEPKVGDIVVFHWPPKPSIDYIKRIVGVPGDTISYIDKELYINGKPMKQTLVGYATDSNGRGNIWQVLEKKEQLPRLSHDIYLRPNILPYNFKNIVVPKGYYFAMGDNRDDSSDSRVWGFVPEKNIVGKAFLVWMSWKGIPSWNLQSIKDAIRWNRLFTSIYPGEKKDHG